MNAPSDIGQQFENRQIAASKKRIADKQAAVDAAIAAAAATSSVAAAAAQPPVANPKIYNSGPLPKSVFPFTRSSAAASSSAAAPSLSTSSKNHTADDSDNSSVDALTPPASPTTVKGPFSAPSPAVKFTTARPMSSALVHECANVAKSLKDQLDTIPTDLLKSSVTLPGAQLPVAAANLLLHLESTLLPYLDDPVSNPAVQNFFFGTVLPPAIGDFPALATLEDNPTDVLLHRFNVHESQRIRRKAELQCAAYIVQAFSRTIGAGYNACILAPYAGPVPLNMAPPPPSLQGVSPWAAKAAFSAHYRGAVSATLDARERQLASPMADDTTLGVHISRYDIKVREMDAIGGITRALTIDQSWRHTQNFIRSIAHLARYAPFIQAYTDTGHTTDATRLWHDFKLWALQHAPSYEQQTAGTAFAATHDSNVAAGPLARAPAVRAPSTISLPVTTTGRISIDALKAAAANQGYVLTPAPPKAPNRGARQPNDRNAPRDRQPQRPYQPPRQQHGNAAPRGRGNAPQRQRRANVASSEPDADPDIDFVADADDYYDYESAAAFYTATGDDEPSDTDDPYATA